MYVSGDTYSWCDFCVYTLDVAIERSKEWQSTYIPEKEWQSTYIPELEDYYDRYMLPEIVNPLFKPSYMM